jgi:hypothetical protein
MFLLILALFGIFNILVNSHQTMHPRFIIFTYILFPYFLIIDSDNGYIILDKLKEDCPSSCWIEEDSFKLSRLDLGIGMTCSPPEGACDKCVTGSNNCASTWDIKNHSSDSTYDLKQSKQHWYAYTIVPRSLRTKECVKEAKDVIRDPWCVGSSRNEESGGGGVTTIGTIVSRFMLWWS